MYVHVSTKISSTSRSRPFPSSPRPLHQNEVKCSAFDIEMIFHSYANKNHFHEKGCVLGLRTQQQEKVKKKNKVLHILGGSNKVYYGKLLNGEFKHCTLSACLVPVRRLFRPSRSMHFGDVSETNGRETPRQSRSAHAWAVLHFWKVHTVKSINNFAREYPSLQE